MMGRRTEKKKHKVFDEFTILKKKSNFYSKFPRVDYLDENDLNDYIFDLRKKFSYNKDYPKEVELPLLLALSRFPDLKDVKIEVRFHPILLMMNSRPRSDFFLRKREDRIYRIYINTLKLSKRGVLFSDLPFNAKVGGLAHELSHVVDYSRKSRKDLFIMIFKYLFRSYRKKLEWKTDLEAINRGFALQLFDFTSFLLNDSDSSLRYKRYKKRNYLSDKDIYDYTKMVYDEELKWI